MGSFYVMNSIFMELFTVYAVCRCLSWGKRGHINIECRLKARDVTALGVQKNCLCFLCEGFLKSNTRSFFSVKIQPEKAVLSKPFFLLWKNIYCGVVVLFRDQINAFQRRKVKIRVGLNNNEKHTFFKGDGGGGDI